MSWPYEPELGQEVIIRYEIYSDKPQPGWILVEHTVAEVYNVYCVHKAVSNKPMPFVEYINKYSNNPYKSFQRNRKVTTDILGILEAVV
jgi:hypothetical protein